MTTGAAALLALCCLGVSLAATRTARAWARRRHLLDHPNDRSSHVLPTPRMGGVGLMMAFLPAAAAIALLQARTSGGGMLALVGATVVISAVGLIDDLRPLPARYRFGAQLAAAAAVLAANAAGVRASLAPLGDYLPVPVLMLGSVLWVVWATNLYNFMDGIDGLAGGQAVFAGLGVAGASLLLGNSLATALALCLAGSALGFLRYNLPRASIFMGDAGSTAIGFFLAALPFAAGSPALPAPVVFLALSLFVFDATLTLLRRVWRRERWLEAHRTHFYQRPLKLGVGHAPVTYTAYAGMAAVATFAALYPIASAEARAVLAVAAAGLFGAAAFTVRSLERRAAGRAESAPSSPRS